MEGPVTLAFECIRMMERRGKPRRTGLTYARDRGLGLKALDAALESGSTYIDILKLASFIPRLQPKELIRRKVALCAEHDVKVGLGGALLEIALLQGQDVLKAFLSEVQELGISHIEVCRQVAILSMSHLLDVIGFVKSMGLEPLAEVGVAYGITADEPVFVDEAKLMSSIRSCLEAGAAMVLLESEGITESRHKKDQRWDVVSKIAGSFDLDRLMFEADDPESYTRYIKEHGPEVNLFVDISRVLPLECARRGGWGMHPVINRVATFYRDDVAGQGG